MNLLVTTNSFQISANMVRTFDPIIEKIVAHIVELYARAKARGKQPKVNKKCDVLSN